MRKIGKKHLISTFRAMSISILLFISFILYYSYVEASVVQSNPFWMPLEFDIGTGYFKANVFISGLKVDTGLLKICVISQATNHKLCHYMNAAEEEGQIIHPYVSVHAGIYVFPSSQVPVDTDVNVCVTILKDNKIICKTVSNSAETTEEMARFNLGR
jgi:hypothetical protein